MKKTEIIDHDAAHELLAVCERVRVLVESGAWPVPVNSHESDINRLRNAIEMAHCTSH